MPSHTKKVGIAGRFGPRYGKRIRERWAELKSLQKRKWECPYCKAKAVKALAVGIWYCEKCGKKFTGKAWVPYEIK